MTNTPDKSEMKAMTRDEIRDEIWDAMMNRQDIDTSLTDLADEKTWRLKSEKPPAGVGEIKPPRWASMTPMVRHPNGNWSKVHYKDANGNWRYVVDMLDPKSGTAAEVIAALDTPV